MTIKTMRAKYRGRDADTGATINPGDDIKFCTVTRRAWLHEPGDCRVQTVPGSRPGLVVTYNNGRPQYFIRNPRGRCIDAPACGCCTI